jgi:SagB-type dehydrogenase family enzyme
LWAAYGITKPNDTYAFLRGGLRTAPSAGGLYPLDIYLIVGNVNGLEAGIYKYKSSGHELLLLKSGDIRRELCNAASEQLMVENAPATIVYSAIFERTVSKYGHRGRERYVYMDLGHSAENVYLQAGALDIGTCAVAAFDDLKLKQVVGMTREEDPLYLMPIGKLRKKTD